MQTTDSINNISVMHNLGFFTKKGLLKEKLLGYAGILNSLNHIIKSRKVIQSNRKISDDINNEEPFKLNRFGKNKMHNNSSKMLPLISMEQ